MGTAVRHKLTTTQMTDLTTSFLKATNADPSKINLSYSQAFAYRHQTVKNIVDEIKKTWKPSPVLTLHWDGKLFNTLDDANVQEGRLPDLVSGVNGTKLLGVPALETEKKLSMGYKIASATVSHLDEWKCADNFRAMVFDTTASNTESLTTACVSV